MGFKGEQLGSLTQFPTRNAVASWRQEEIKISGNALKTMYFSDTTPNMFYLQNPNDVPLLVGITKTPTQTSYEYKVEPNTSRTFGRPIPTSQLYILNTSNKDITVSLFSVNDEFNLSILQNQSISVGDINGTFDGIIRGFSDGVSLPSGNNTLGNVNINESLPAGNNNIGIVTFTDEVNENIKMLADIKNELIESNKKIIDFLFFERESVSDSFTIDFSTQTFSPNCINFIANDDENAIIVTVNFANGNSKVFTLAQGDIFGDIKAEITSLTLAPKNASSVVSWRVMVGLRG